MRSRGFLSLLAVALLSVLPPEASGTSAEPTLSYVVPVTSGFEWRLREHGAERVLIRSERPPLPLFWDASDGSVLYELDAELHRVRLASGSAPERIAPVPPFAGERAALWVDAATGRLRALLVETIAADALGGSPEAPRWTLADGSEIAGASEPPWGDPIACSVVEWDGAAWAPRVRVASKGGADGTPGCSVVDDHRRERGTSQARLLASYGCGDGLCGSQPPTALAAAVRAQPGSDPYVEEIRWLGDPASGGLLFGTARGDTWHATTPVWWAKDGAPPLRLELATGRQITLARAGALVLVAAEWTGERPHLVDLRSGRIVFRGEGRAAVWVPDRSSRPADSP